ncbi:MAG: NADH-quinone oxidoreductase subunit NuoK [Actinobacteria bacterium]|nr:NADH-quinone oxidoreductase subunit NuoK [Actinomycetota bacterium]
MTLNHFLLLGAILFSVGLFGALSRRNAVAILMSIELMFNGVNVTLVGFSRYVATANPLAGQIFAIFIITVAAAEAAVGLAIIIAIYRDRKTIDIPEIDLMKW